MRRARIAAGTTLAVVLAGCGDTGDATQARVEELEAELAQVRESAAELMDENAALYDELQHAEAPHDHDDTGEGTDPPDDGDGHGHDDDADEDPDIAPTDPQPERSAEGLNEQLRTLFAPGDLPDGYEPGATDWRSAGLPDGLDEVYETPGDLAFDLAAALDAGQLGTDTWETTTRVLFDEDDPDLAYVAVLSWGFADDAVAGRDLRVTVTAADGGWSPGGAEERFHCRRGVSDDLCV